MFSIPGVTRYYMPSADPLMPYRGVLTEIYKLLLEEKERVLSCKPVMYEGKHVMGMYDIVITDTRDPGRTPPTRSIRIYPTLTYHWDHWNAGGGSK